MVRKELPKHGIIRTGLAWLSLTAVAAAGCAPRPLDKSLASAELTAGISQQKIAYSLFLGPQSCPKGCADCFSGQIFDVAKAEGWVTAECEGENHLRVEPTAAGKRLLAGQPGSPQANGSVFHEIAIGQGEIQSVFVNEQYDRRTEVSYRWAYRPTATGLALLSGGPRVIGNSTLRLCGQDRKWIAFTEDCDFAIRSASAFFVWDSDRAAWTIPPAPKGGIGQGFLGPK